MNLAPMNPNQLIVAIGSLRPPKVEAVRTVISQIAPMLGYTHDRVRYIAREYGEDKIGVLLENIATKFDMTTALQEVRPNNIENLNHNYLYQIEPFLPL